MMAARTKLYSVCAALLASFAAMAGDAAPAPAPAPDAAAEQTGSRIESCWI